VTSIPVTGAILHILGLGSPAKVRKVVVGTVVIRIVASFHAIRAGSDESCENETLYEAMKLFPIA
jgi:hypothetical protein